MSSRNGFRIIDHKWTIVTNKKLILTVSLLIHSLNWLQCPMTSNQCSKSEQRWVLFEIINHSNDENGKQTVFGEADLFLVIFNTITCPCACRTWSSSVAGESSSPSLLSRLLLWWPTTSVRLFPSQVHTCTVVVCYCSRFSQGSCIKVMSSTGKHSMLFYPPKGMFTLFLTHLWWLKCVVQYGLHQSTNKRQICIQIKPHHRMGQSVSFLSLLPFFILVVLVIITIHRTQTSPVKKYASVECFPMNRFNIFQL